MIKNLCCLAVWCFLLSCNNNPEQPAKVAETKPAGDTTKVTFFPVTSFLRGQLLVLDSLPVTVLKIQTTAGKTDSAWIKRDSIRPLLAPFISTRIDTSNLTAFFKETKFNDQTVEAITFTYDPITAIPDSVDIRHWDVYVQPETGKVKKVYLLKQVEKDKKKYTQQLTWQTDKWAKIVMILNKPDGSSEIESETKLVWDFN
jgi:hypothetical protein